ncbi:MAG: hypothetical protein OES57_14145 [Acidimicrobiia bacterium]|nr:hypothetical protein [Acidimicrobiia bacterium]
MSALSAAAENLLPGADEAPRCADHQRHLGVDPGGSAIDTDLLILVDIARPWPAKIADHPLLTDRAPEIELAGGRARVVATVPVDGARHRIRAYWRDGPAATGVGFWFDRPTDLDAVFAELGRVHPSEAAADPSVPAPARLVLVCAHGSRDQCCGTDGTRLAAQLGQARPGLAVERTSHLGGHRFSPTALTLPDGRMWADLDLDTLLRIIDRVGDAAAVTPKCRGWWGAAAGEAQMAERAALTRHGWELDDHERDVVALADDRYEVRWAGGPDRFRVTAAREVPTIACRQPGGRPAKPGHEYSVADD